GRGRLAEARRARSRPHEGSGSDARVELERVREPGAMRLADHGSPHLRRRYAVERHPHPTAPVLLGHSALESDREHTIPERDRLLVRVRVAEDDTGFLSGDGLDRTVP